MKLGDQGQHQTRLGPCEYWIGPQLRRLQGLEELWGTLVGLRMTSLLEHLGDLLDRGRLSHLWRWIGLQKQQGRALLQFAKEREGHRIIGFETCREPFRQTRMHLNQGILIAVGDQSTQIGKVNSSCFGQQRGVNGIGFR